MNKSPRIEAEVTLFPKDGLKHPPICFPDSNYRPHLVIENPKTVVDGKDIDENYIGIEFDYNPVKPEFNEPFLAVLSLIFYPHPMYEALVTGTSFTIREGAQTVGYGHIKSGVENLKESFSSDY